MKKTFINNLLYFMEQSLSKTQLDKLESALYEQLTGLEIVELEPIEEVNVNNQNLIEQFISAKRIEGCSEKTLKYYLRL